MKKPGCILRLLCGAVDVILIMAPVQFIMMGIFDVSEGQADLLFKLLFAVYGALMIEYCGTTAGKYFGKLTVVDESGGKASMLYLGLRELAKSLYFIPVIGWAAGLASIIMIFVRKDGRALHDLIGNTRVLYTWQADSQKTKEGTGEGAGDEYADE